MRKARVIAALVLGISMTALAASPASAELVSPGHKKSWGKAGVTLEQYWTDSAECAHFAADTDLDGTAPGDALVLASRIYDTQTGPDDVMRALRLAPADIQWRRAATIMEANLEACLMERGYVKFQLTDEQHRMLRMYEVGTLERRQYLHSLASDANVLATQAVMES